MSYSVTCPSCNTSFPVDPKKVPEEGVLAQCSMCPEIFEVTRPDDSEAEPPIKTPAVSLDAKDFVIETTEGLVETEAPTAAVSDAHEENTDLLGGREITFDEPIISPEPAVAPEVGIAPEPEVELAPEPEVELEPEPEVELAPEPEVAADPEPVADTEPGTPAVAPIQFGRRDPSDKARSLARSLVSDIIAYHKDKHTQSLGAGTLAEDFDEEVQKSWKEYTDQVDPDVVSSSMFFNDALNEILAGGEDVFNLDG